MNAYWSLASLRLCGKYSLRSLTVNGRKTVSRKDAKQQRSELSHLRWLILNPVVLAVPA